MVDGGISEVLEASKSSAASSNEVNQVDFRYSLYRGEIVNGCLKGVKCSTDDTFNHP